ncbi:MAG TPA: DUF2066 domain-containing protein [Thiotrichales bacterium]|nr:DUF2066 domain-containing protein [Thiotrichales bacterium]
MSMSRILLLFLLLMPLQAGAVAVRVPDLFEAAVPVEDQSRGEREAALARALAEVVVRVSGQADAHLQPAVVRAMTGAARLVQQYSYRQAAPEEEGGEPRLLLQVRFDRRAVEKLIAEGGLPLWPERRPLTLVWLVVEAGPERRLVSGEVAPELQQVLEAEGRRRGVPLMLPLWDLEDRSRVSLAEIWGGFLEGVLEASRRYGVDSVLVGRLFRRSDGAWSGSWTLHTPEEELRWQSEGEAMTALLASGVDVLADRLASTYAVRGGGEENGSFHLVVEGVEGLEGYARVERYLLEELEVVERGQLESLSVGRLVFRLHLKGGEEDLRRALALDRLLLPLDAGDTAAGLLYRFEP